MGGRCGFAGAVAVCVVASVLAGCGSSSSGMKLTAYLVHGSQETGFTTQGAPTVESSLQSYLASQYGGWQRPHDAEGRGVQGVRRREHRWP